MANKFVKIEQLGRFLENCKNIFVVKEGGKVLSDNNYSTEEKEKLANLAEYTLPAASYTALGGVIVGENLTIKDGVLSAVAGEQDLSAYAKTADIESVYETKQTASDTYATKASLVDYVTTATLDNYALKSDVASAVKYKGSVKMYAELPTTGMEVGWMYNVQEADDEHGIKAGDNVVYNGNGWDNYSGTVTIEAASDTEIDALFV